MRFCKATLVAADVNLLVAAEAIELIAHEIEYVSSNWTAPSRCAMPAVAVAAPERWKPAARWRRASRWREIEQAGRRRVLRVPQRETLRAPADRRCTTGSWRSGGRLAPSRPRVWLGPSHGRPASEEQPAFAAPVRPHHGAGAEEFFPADVVEGRRGVLQHVECVEHGFGVRVPRQTVLPGVPRAAGVRCVESGGTTRCGT